MRVFVTGATGWVGSAVVAELIGAGHSVSGLARDPAKAGALTAAGAGVVAGTLDDVAVLRQAAGAVDAVIHTAFNHDFSQFAANAAQDARAIAAMGEALVGSDRPIVVTSGMAYLAPGRIATEADRPDPGFPRQSERAAQALADKGVRAVTMRLAPSVHGVGEKSGGFIPRLFAMAREAGVSATVGDGDNRWCGVHRGDAAVLYRLVLETGAGQPVYHAAAEESISFKAIAEAIGAQLGLPVASREAEHFGWFAGFAGADMAASAARTRAWTGWRPTGPGLLADIADPAYAAGFAAV